MKLRNPWIDPRISEVCPKAIQAYLLRHGWKALKPDQPNLLPFAGPQAGKNQPIVQVPLREQARDYPQRVIELMTELAMAEERYAVQILDEILELRIDSPTTRTNGPRTERRVKSKVN